MQNKSQNNHEEQNIRSYKESFGKTLPLWEGFRLFLEEEYGNIVEEWKYYNIKSGWILKVTRNKRTLFYLTPSENKFRVAFSFGEKAIAEIEKSNLPEILIERLKNARKYVEGRGLQVNVMQLNDLRIIKKLVDIKIKN